MIPRPPRPTRTATLFPYTPLFRSPGLAVPEVNIEQMVELRLAKAGDDARLGRKFCETVACRIVTRPVANECAARNARLGEANPAGGDAFAEAAILVTDGASDRREIVERDRKSTRLNSSHS